MKNIIRFVLGPLCFVAALWLPFYIGGPVLPDGWLDPNSGRDYWWSLPMVTTLLVSAIGIGVLGVILISHDRFKR